MQIWRKYAWDCNPVWALLPGRQVPQPMSLDTTEIYFCVDKLQVEINVNSYTQLVCNSKLILSTHSQEIASIIVTWFTIHKMYFKWNAVVV